jgi:L-ascorbate metabolism protein UlaG (beta-lactamase superfamily)
MAHAAERPPASVLYVGHGTVLVAIDGVRLLTDPLLRTRVAHLRRFGPVHPEALRAIDAVLISHAHRDHLDLPSLERLGRAVPLIVPRGLAPLLRRRHFEQVVEVEEGDEVTVGALGLRATHADHDGARPPLPARAPALGYAVLGTRRVYFAGDTGLFDGMDGLVPDLDLALLPIWGWGASLGRGTHLDPEDAAEALRLLRPRLVVPIHWGTYAPLHRSVTSVPAFLGKPGPAFVRAAAERAPEVEVRLLAPGEALAF